MLSIFYRRFYILLFLLWLAAAGAMFVFAVWGDLDAFVTDFQTIMKTDAEAPEQNATETIVTQAADIVVNRVQTAADAVRREVVGEVRAVEDTAEKVFRVVKAETQPQPRASKQLAADGRPAVTQQVESRAAALKSQSREQSGTGVLTAIAFSQTDDRLVAHLTTSRTADKITVFWLEGPTRLVVDLRGDWKNVARRINRFSDSFMYRVIVGMHPDRLRVVFKFNDPKAPTGERPRIIHTAKGLDVVVDDPAK